MGFSSSGFLVQGLGFGVSQSWVSRFGVSSWTPRVLGFRYGFLGFGVSTQDVSFRVGFSGSWVSSSWCRVSGAWFCGSRYRVWCFEARGLVVEGFSFGVFVVQGFVLGLRVWGSRFLRFEVSRFRVWCFEVRGVGFDVSRFLVWGFILGVGVFRGSGFRGSGFRVRVFTILGFALSFGFGVSLF